jgi:pectin methylesterase-like acyl-CoA thioesterase
MKFIFTKNVFLCLLYCTCCLAARAQLTAFPGAEGAGKFTSGGRGTAAALTAVFEVTNLNDDNNPGSLRYALSQSATYRTVVFRVSGIIHLTSRLTIRANTTIAGQTAPGSGICIADHPVVISGDNVIVRYLRIRMGDKNQNKGMVDGSGSDDAFSNLGNKNIIIDHCSISWSSDEALTIYRGDSVTVQWCFVSEPLNYSYHFETGDVNFEEHGYGGIWGSRNGSFHHNLIAHAKGRLPRFAGSSTYPPGTVGQENTDFRNNVIYNWGSYSTNGGEGGNYNLVNNYYKSGPSTSTGNTSGIAIRNMIMNPSKSTDLPYPKLFITGNYVDGSTNATQNNWLGIAMAGGSLADTVQSKVTAAFNVLPINTNTAQQAYDLVLQYAGAVLPARDTLDERIAGNVKNKTGSIIDVQGGYPHGTPYIQTVNAWPTLVSAAAPADDDHDGMPNAWETSNGLNPNDPLDRGGIAGNGYTNLENYLNGIGASAISVAGSINNFTQSIGTPSSVKTYTVAASNLNGNLIITAPAGYELSVDGNNWFNNGTPLTLAPSSGSVPATTIFVRLNAGTAGLHTGNITHSSAGVATVSLAVSGSSSVTPAGTSVIVAQDGTGNYATVQAAIDAAPAGRTSAYIIYIKNGKYKEKVNIPSNKPFIHLVGESVANTIITWDDYSGKAMPGGGTYGTSNSATVTVNGADFMAMNITFENTTGDAPQALAINVNADRAVLLNCRFLGGQDTILTNGSGRQYFKNCYVDGVVDFIFGSATALFDSCVIYARTRLDNLSGSYITAANTPAGQTYGYVFRNCIIPANRGVTTYVLGRPWQNDGTSSPPSNTKVVFINSTMSSSIKQQGWDVWNAQTNTSVIYYGEYKTKKFDGSLVDVSQRVPWSFQLSDAQAAGYTNTAMFGAWDPCAVSAAICAPFSASIAVSNFRGVKVAANSSFTWNISWPIAGVTYELYRSTDKISFARVHEQTSPNDTAVNYNYSEAVPPAGITYYYYIKALKAGFSPHITDTIAMSSTPVVTVSGAPGSFLQALGTPSVSQSYTVSAVNLVNDLVITPPVGYEISTDGINWKDNASPVTIVPVNGNIAVATISVRLNASAVGTVAGNITHVSAGANNINVSVTGTVQADPLPVSGTLIYWPMTANNTDSASIRATGVAATVPSFNRFFVSNGAAVPGLVAYSGVFGQVFSATANGDGSWTTASGGPGGNLGRSHYEQFTITPDGNYNITVDSLIVSSSFYGSSSNTKLAVVYSLSNFVNDSTNVTGGTGPTGLLATTANGAFATPVVLNNQTGGTTDNFRFALNNASGVAVASGKTLTIRLYFSCGSTSTGRYAKLKDVYAKGYTGAFVVPPSINVTGTLNTFAQTTGTPSAVQTYTVAVTNATTSLVITPPVNYEVSPDGTTWYTNASPLTILRTGNAVPLTTIRVRLNATIAGNYAGNISNASSGATAINVAVTGATQNPPATINVTGTLNAFLQVTGSPSAVQTYTVVVNNATANLVITPPAGYEISPDGNAWYNSASPLTINRTGNTVPSTTIRVRLNASASGNYAGNIAHASTSAPSVSVAVTGVAQSAPTITGSGTLQPFVQTVGTPSASQTYRLNGSFLLSNITVASSAGYEISGDGGTWIGSTGSINFIPANGVANPALYIRLNATAVGNYPGTITVSATGITPFTINLSGTTFTKFVLAPNPATNAITLYHPGFFTVARIVLYNANGVRLREFRPASATSRTTMDIGFLPAGVYWMEYVGKDETYRQKFVKQ